MSADQSANDAAQYLQRLGQEARQLRLDPCVELVVPVRTHGYSAPSDEVRELFNRAVPYLELRPAKHVWAAFNLVTSVDRNSAIGERAIQDAVLLSWQNIQYFLLCLSAATHSIVVWRGISIDDTSISARDLVNDRPINIKFQRDGGPGGSVQALSAENLADSVRMLSEVLTLHPRFVQLFQTGEVFLEQPAFPMLRFVEDAFLNFYKCLEHLLMDRVLSQRGQLNPYLYGKAVGLLGLSEDPRVPAGREIVKTRGRRAAHMLCGQVEFSVSAQEAYSIKKLVDVFLVAAAQKGFLRARSG